jgi:hypothetical protein
MPKLPIPLHRRLRWHAGAQFGLKLLWSRAFTYPLMVGIQVGSAHMCKLLRIEIDTYFGMGFFNLVAFGGGGDDVC